MRRKCAEEKPKITSTVEELNCLSNLCGLPTTSAEEVMSGDFVWSFNQCDIDSTTSHVFTNNVDESNDYSFLETESFLLDEYKHRYCVRKDTMKTLHGRLAITNSRIALARVQL
ncbi:uncharacterized protein LOC124456725 [Xenia sp. Carnegie-2017]|uniref:uncharacterized protein LOC124456725 n=1 Tax=Xenia sp. Carnegie-2017 TaxID=2897299 RepID=UPI001F04AC25|nr:uncharacterized protein LOC124456725 [Xenia sp. Carnegie-2017]